MSTRVVFGRSTGRTRKGRRLCLWLLAGWLGFALWGVFKPLPEGISVATALRPAQQLRFLADESYVDPTGDRRVEQRIFDRIIDHIGRARHLIVMDAFLFNDFAGNPDGEDLRPLSREVADALIARKTQVPGITIVLITDPINTLYGGLPLPVFERLTEAGIEVIETDLTALRDSNPLWSGLWRMCCQWFGNRPDGGWLPNPMGPQKITLRSVLALLNFKANHRKTFIADTPAGWVGVVTSGNPHDASSAHSNVAVEFHGDAALELLATEQAVVAFSAPGLRWPALPAVRPAPARPGPRAMQILTEARIRDAVIDALQHTGPGDRVDLAMFYLSHRRVIEALVEARRRGVRTRVLLDPNRDAFGRRKSGIPNRPVGWALHEAGVDVRWCNTQGEQCHEKLLLVTRSDGRAELISGSANLTRRNLDDYNLETNVRVTADASDPVIVQVADWFERRWRNLPDRRSSLDYEALADEDRLKYWLYRVMESSGLSTF